MRAVLRSQCSQIPPVTLLLSPVFGGVYLNEYTFIYLSEDKTNAGSICLMCVSFLISFCRASAEAKAPWVSCPSVPQSRGQCDWIGKAKVNWITQVTLVNLVRLLSCPAAGETSSSYGLHLPKQDYDRWSKALSTCEMFLMLYPYCFFLICG